MFIALSAVIAARAFPVVVGVLFPQCSRGPGERTGRVAASALNGNTGE